MDSTNYMSKPNKSTFPRKIPQRCLLLRLWIRYIIKMIAVYQLFISTIAGKKSYVLVVNRRYAIENKLGLPANPIYIYALRDMKGELLVHNK